MRVLARGCRLTSSGPHNPNLRGLPRASKNACMHTRGTNACILTAAVPRGGHRGFAQYTLGRQVAHISESDRGARARCTPRAAATGCHGASGTAYAHCMHVHSDDGECGNVCNDSPRRTVGSDSAADRSCRYCNEDHQCSAHAHRARWRCCARPKKYDTSWVALQAETVVETRTPR